MSWFEISPKTYQIRIYDEHPDNYAACFQLYRDGDRGYLHSLIGKDYYKLVKEHIADIFKEIGVRSVEASMVRHHAEAMKRLLAGELDVEVLGEASVAGRDMAWVVIKPKETA